MTIVEQLLEKGYREFKDSWKNSKKALQKKFTDDIGTKYFLNFYMYNHSEISEGRDTSDRWQVECQFGSQGQGTYKWSTNIEVFGFWFEENQWKHDTVTLDEIEQWFDKLFFSMDFEYYEL